MQVVLNLPENDGENLRGQPTQFVSVSEARALRGADSWLADNGAFLRRAIIAGVATAASLAADGQRLETAIAGLPETKHEAVFRCGIGGREAWTGSAVAPASDPADHLLYNAHSATLVACTEVPIP
jgi:hypothetical protein